jgi:hypothetical protein
MRKFIKGLIKQFQDWQEIGNLRAEASQLKYWRERGDERWPRILKRLEELGAINDVEAIKAMMPVERRRSFADRHPELAEFMRIAEQGKKTASVVSIKGRA